MSEIKLNFAFLCDLAFIGEEGKLCIIGIFKNIKGTTFPLKHPLMYVVTNVSVANSGHYEEEIRILRIRDKAPIVSPVKFDVNISIKNGKHAEIGGMGRITDATFNEAGEYEIQVFINNEFITAIPFSVIAS